MREGEKDMWWILNIFPPPKLETKGDFSSQCFELIVRETHAKIISHHQMGPKDLRDLVMDALFNSESDKSYYRYFFMKPPGVDIHDRDIPSKAKGNRLRAPSGPNDTLIFKIVMNSTVGDISFWLPLKPVFGVFSKVTSNDVQEKIESVEAKVDQTSTNAERLEKLLMQTRANVTKVENRFEENKSTEVELRKMLGDLQESNRNHSQAINNTTNLLKQQQHRLQEQTKQLQSTQVLSQREIQELKELILKETEKSMRMKMSISTQNEHYAKMMHNIKKEVDTATERIVKLEALGVEEIIENVQLKMKDLEEQLHAASENGGVVAEGGASLGPDASKKFEKMQDRLDLLEREMERMRSAKPSEEQTTTDMKKMKKSNDILRMNHLKALQENASIKYENMELKQMIKSLQDDNRDLQKDIEELLNQTGGAMMNQGTTGNSELNDLLGDMNQDDDINDLLNGTNELADLENEAKDLENDLQDTINLDDDLQQPIESSSSSSAPRFDHDKCGSEITISQDGHMATREYHDTHQWQTVLGEKTYYKAGKYEWSLRLEDGCSDSDILVGVVDPNLVDVDDGDVSKLQRGWVLFLSDGTVMHAEEEKAYSNIDVVTDDVITVVLDLDNHTLGFRINGQDYGVAFDNVTGPVCAAVSFAHDDQYKIAFIE
eukprot:CAMPEP_0117424934 /NCGR_PEP_ID=MMETSP0758-20121206/5278_1 /TAXON_ID=63605 /ORGANISM="Percolomonas cosmopolitus, Strain AE-1 (ATCC 50343)" /LENGTH=661 /DNA_ID=CAMNT_0005209059 /DNA_START=271 /DNA_END=2256 /DNA_ORIENTATION=+